MSDWTLHISAILKWPEIKPIAHTSTAIIHNCEATWTSFASSQKNAYFCVAVMQG